MKKIILVFLMVVFLSVFVGCSSDVSGANASNGTQSKSIDVNLTKLSSTMVYAEVNNMITNPESYIGKIVKMRGQFAVYDGGSQKYFACIIKDATACCSQGIEFVLSGKHKYPNDYPSLGSDITVVGKFQTYKEGKQKYCHLVDAKFA